VLAQLGWKDFHRRVSTHRSVNLPALRQHTHPAASFLHRLARNGVPAPSSERPWSLSKKDSVLRRGPHRSATIEYASFLHEDMYNMVQDGYWTVLPFSAVRHLSNLKLAPAGVVPQRERRPRPIVDYSFTDVNHNSLAVAPYHAMQFGTALPRLLQRIVYCNRLHGPPLMAKIDLSDGYYRVPLSPAASLELAVVIPPDNTDVNLIAIPLSLPMGWRDSPPYFCAFTETVADSSNDDVRHSTVYPDHDLLQTCQQPPLDTQHQSFHDTALQPLGDTSSPPLAYTDIYMDDFCLLAQPPCHINTLNTVLHNITRVFHDPPHSPRQHVVSHSKIAKGDAAWSTTKRLLGWDVDTRAMTLSIPPPRQAKLIAHIASFDNRKRVSRRRWQQLIGELRSVALALPSAKFIFSVLQHALLDQTASRIRLNKTLRTALADWRVLLSDLLQPVSLYHVVPTAPTMIAGCDASKDGMGGFIMDLTRAEHPPIAWRYPFPNAIQDDLVSASNPTGAINNSHLELAAIVASTILMLQYSSGSCHTFLCSSDNIPAVSWIRRGSTSSVGPSARLLRVLHQLGRITPFTVSALFTPGLTNSVADFLSRSFHVSDAAVLQTLADVTQHSWTLAPLPSDIAYTLTSALSNTTSLAACRHLDPAPSTQPGTSGCPFAPQSTWTPTSQRSTILSPPYSFLPDNTVQDTWLPQVVLSVLEQWKRPFEPWDRRSPAWGSGIHASIPPAVSTSASPGNSPHTPKTTLAPTAKNPSRWPSSYMLPNFASMPGHRNMPPLPICSSWPSTSFSGQGNMPTPAARMLHHSAFAMPISTSIINDCAGVPQPNNNGTLSRRWPWNLTAKRTASKVNSSACRAQATNAGAQCESFRPASLLSATNRLPTTPLSTPIARRPAPGAPSKQPTLLPTFGPRRSHTTSYTNPTPTPSLPGPYGRLEPWHSFVQALTQPKFSSSDVGDQRRCSDTCTSKPCPSHHPLPPPCSLMAISP